jgi:hypothetical protein
MCARSISGASRSAGTSRAVCEVSESIYSLLSFIPAVTNSLNAWIIVNLHL